MADPEKVVREFCSAWSELDLDKIMAFFAPDAVYHNMPVDPLIGTDAIAEFIAGFTASVDRVDFEITHLAVIGSVVLTERIDTFVTGDQSVGLGVMGTFELDGAKITAWRDYFDMAQAMTALGMS